MTNMGTQPLKVANKVAALAAGALKALARWVTFSKNSLVGGDKVVAANVNNAAMILEPMFPSH